MDEKEIDESLIKFFKENVPGYKHNSDFKKEDWVWKWIQKSDWPQYRKDGWVCTLLEDIDTVHIRKRKH